MADRTLTPVVEDYTSLEGPRWHDGRLWLSDFYQFPNGSIITTVDVPRAEGARP